jgi:hypothetical protein
VRSVFVPEDETCFCLYEAASAADVLDAARCAGLAFGTVVEAIAGGEARGLHWQLDEGGIDAQFHQ